MIHIRVVSDRLSDGSHVYSVHIGDSAVVLPAITERHADLLADKIVAAIHEHTNEEAVVKYIW